MANKKHALAMAQWNKTLPKAGGSSIAEKRRKKGYTEDSDSEDFMGIKASSTMPKSSNKKKRKKSKRDASSSDDSDNSDDAPKSASKTNTRPNNGKEEALNDDAASDKNTPTRYVM